MAEPARIGIRAYSRHRGCTHHAVQKAITGGRLTELSKANPTGSFVRDGRGHAKIDPVAADDEWSSNTDELQQRERHRQPAPRSAQAAPAGGELFPQPAPPAAPDAGGPAQPRKPTLASAQAVRTTYLAQIAKLEYEERLGSLVKADGVRVEAFKVARTVRDALLSMPDRLAAELATMGDTHEVRERLHAEIRACLEGLSSALS